MFFFAETLLNWFDLLNAELLQLSVDCNCFSGNCCFDVQFMRRYFARITGRLFVSLKVT